MPLLFNLFGKLFLRKPKEIIEDNPNCVVRLARFGDDTAILTAGNCQSPRPNKRDKGQP